MNVNEEQEKINNNDEGNNKNLINDNKDEEKKGNNNNNKMEIDDEFVHSTEAVQNNELNNPAKVNNKEENYLQLLEDIRHKGATQYEWKELKPIIINYYKKVVEEFEFDNINNNKVDDEIIEYLNELEVVPFTLQRIAELLLEPKLYYKSLYKYNFAFKKLVNIDLD